MEYIVIDTETTGTEPGFHEILQVSAITDEGEVLFDSLFRPHAKSWVDAMHINNITPEMVRYAPRIERRTEELGNIIGNAKKIVGYNTSFDLKFLKEKGIVPPKDAEIVDVMNLFAPIYGEMDKKRGRYRWQKLAMAANYYNFDWGSLSIKAHNSLADCFATLHVYKAITENGKDI